MYPPILRLIRRLLDAGWLTGVVVAWLATIPMASAQVLTPEVERGLAWLQARVQSDGSVQHEDDAMAERQQVRCEVYVALFSFSRTTRLPLCGASGTTQTELLGRRGNAVPTDYWMSDGGIAPDAGFNSSSVVDTNWAFGASNLTADRRQAAIAYLFAHQAPSGGFLASEVGPETVAGTALIGRQLAILSNQLTGTQKVSLAAAAGWVEGQADSPGVWGSLYDTALAHLFLVLQLPDPAREAITYEHLVGQQQADGSWLGDPFVTALVLRAAAARSLPKVVESGFKLRVIDAVTRLPIGSASVSGGPYTPTDAEGYATVAVAPTASLKVTISKPGYQSQTMSVAILAGTVADLGEVALQPQPASVVIAGNVTDEGTGSPLAQVRGNVYVDGVFSRLLSSDTSGHYDGYVGVAGHYRIEYSLYGYIDAVAEFDAVLGNSYRVDVRLAAKADNSDGGFFGTVTDAATGQPLKNVQVYWRSVSSATKLVYTATDGSYALSGLVRESGGLSFSLGGYLSQKASGVVPGSPPSQADVALDKAASPPTSGNLTGKAWDKATGQALPGALLEITDKSTNAPVASVTSDANGLFTVGNLPFKSLKFVASLAGYMNLNGEFQLSASTPQVDLSLAFPRAVGGVIGRLVDKASGKVIAGATVAIGGNEAVSATDGSFSLSGLVPGQQSLTISATGYDNVSIPLTIIGAQTIDLGRVEMVAVVSETLAELTGTVIDEATGAPLSGATVSVYATGIGAITDASGNFTLSGIGLGGQQIRVVAPGYLPQTYRMDFSAPTRYRLDASLTPVAANAVSITASLDAATYPAYADGKLTTSFSVDAGVTVQYAYLEYSLLDAAGRIVKSLPEAGSSATGIVWLSSSILPYAMPFATGNLPPGEYRWRVYLYDTAADSSALSLRNNRVLLAVTEVPLTILATQRIGAIHVVPLPPYANVDVPTPAGYRLEITNKSNVATEFDVALGLAGPGGTVVGSAATHVPIRPDEVFKNLDVSAGSVVFRPHGQYQAQASVSGVDAPTITGGVIAVMPSVRVEVEKVIQPSVIPPGADHRLHINIRLKGVEQ